MNSRANIRRDGGLRLGKGGHIRLREFQHWQVCISCQSFRNVPDMQSGFWRKCRLFVRWSRRAAMVAAVALVCALVWFDRVGVPDFLQRRLVAALHERGVELEFPGCASAFFAG